MIETHITLSGRNIRKESRMRRNMWTPAIWRPDLPLAILEEVEGADPYNTLDRAPNYRLTPKRPGLDETQNIVIRCSRRS